MKKENIVIIYKYVDRTINGLAIYEVNVFKVRDDYNLVSNNHLLIECDHMPDDEGYFKMSNNEILYLLDQLTKKYNVQKMRL